MPVDVNSKDAEVVRRLIPISTLSSDRFKELCSQINVEEGPIGTVLFRQGDTKKEFVYLLNGNVTLHAGGMEMDTIQGDSDASRFAVAHQLPRKVNAVASSKIRYLRIDPDFFNRGPIQERKDDSYEVSDIPEETPGDWMTTLLRSPLFRELPASHLQKLLMALETVHYEKGKVVIHQGDSGDFYYIIKEGRVALSRRSTPNVKEIKLTELKNCDTFGEDSLLSGAPCNVTVTAATDCELLRLDKERFFSLVKDPVLQYLYLDYEKAKQEVGEGAVFLDIRSNEEFSRRHLDGSIHIPFFSLRVQINALDRGKKHIVVCEDGNASNAAAFLLIRNNIDTAVLKGGLSEALKSDVEKMGSDTTFPTMKIVSDPIFSSEQLKQVQYLLDEKRDALSKEVAARNALAARLENHLSENARRVEELENALKQQRAQQQESAEKTAAGLREDLRQAQESIQLLQQQRRELELHSSGQQASLVTEKQALEQSTTELRHRLENAESASKALAAEKQALIERNERLLAEANAGAESMRAEVEKIRVLLNQSREETKSLRDELAESKQYIAEEESRYRELLKQREEDAEKNSALREQLQNTLTSLESELRRAREEKAAVDETCRLLLEERDDLVAGEAASKQSLESLKTASSETKANLAKLSAREEELQHALEAARQEKSVLARQLEDLDRKHNGETESANKQRARLEQKLAQWTEEKQRVAAELEAAGEAAESLKEQLRDSAQREQALEAELAVRNKKLERLAAEQTARDENIRALQQQLESLKTERQTLSEQCRQFAGLNDELKQKLETARDERQALEQKIGKERETAHGRIEALAGELSKADAERRNLAADNDRLQGDLDTTLTITQGLQKQIEALNQQTTAEQAGSAEKLGQMELVLAQHEQAKTKLLTELESNLRQRGSLEEKLTRQGQELEMLLQQRTEDAEQATELERRCRELTKEIAEREEGAKRREADLRSMEQVMESVRAENGDLKEKLKQFEERLKQKSAQVDLEKSGGAQQLGLIQQQLDKIAHERDALKDEIKAQSVECDRLSKENRNLKQDLDRLEELTVRLKEAERLAGTQEEELRFNEQNYSKRLSELESRIADLKNQLACVSRDNTELQTLMEAKEGALQKLEAEFAALKGGEAAGGADIAALNERISWMEKEKERFRRQAESLTEEVLALKEAAHKASLQPGINAGKEAAASQQQIEKIRAQARAEIAAMQKKLADAQQTAESLKKQREEEATPQPFRITPPLNPELTAADVDVFSLAEAGAKPSGAETVQKERPALLRNIAYATAIALVTLALAAGLLFGTRPGREQVKSFLERAGPAATSRNIQ